MGLIKSLKKAYSATLHVWEVSAKLDKLDRQVKKIDQLKAETERLAKELDDNTKYIARLQRIYYESLYKGAVGDFDLKKFFRDMPPASGSLRLHQEGCTKLLEELTKICDKNKISFWLQSGTLLGAVRHGGFIPWDDDMDIGMMREDLYKLIDILKDNKDYTVKVVYDVNVCNRQYRFRTTDPKNPCFIDIFNHDFEKTNPNFDWQAWRKRKDELSQEVYDDLPEEALKQWHKEVFVDDDSELGKIIRRSMDKILPRKFHQYSPENSQVVWQFDNLNTPHHSGFDYDEIFPFEKIKFEGKMYNAPHDTDRYLRSVFDNYYTLPNDIAVHYQHIQQGGANDQIIEEFLKKK